MRGYSNSSRALSTILYSIVHVLDTAVPRGAGVSRAYHAATGDRRSGSAGVAHWQWVALHDGARPDVGAAGASGGREE